MKFMVTWDISEDKWLPILKLWAGLTPQQRADAGPGVKILGRWHDMAARKGVAVLETVDLASAMRYAGQWNPHMGLSIAPVLDDEESAVVAKQVLEASGA
jgi:hypothetical protein